MNRPLGLCLSTCLLALVGCGKHGSTPKGPQPVTNPAQYADPRMGSGGYAYAAGNANPSAEVPNGMMRVGPDTSGAYGTFLPLHFTGYWANDDTILGFSHLHLHGTGARDYGALAILPVPAYDAGKFRVEDYASTFAKSSEVVTPGYYGVTLDKGPIKAELTATAHASEERYTFPVTALSGTIIIDLNHSLSKVTSASVTLVPGSNTVQGQIQTSGGMSGGYPLFFAIRFRQPWTAQHVWTSSDMPGTGLTASGTGVGVALDFALSGGGPVELQVGLSMVSAEGATANLAAELPAFDFDGTHAKAEAAWNQRLGALRVYGGTDAQRRVFYSAFHHAFVMPGVYSDVDGSYRYRDKTQMASDFHFINDMSLWDTYRSLNPLYDLVAPDVALDFAQSLYAMAKIDGQFPKWPLATSDSGSMVGASADIVLSDAFVKGITGFDAMGAYKYLRDAALAMTLPAGEGRGGRDSGFQDYATSGYVYAGDGSSVSLTCEYSQDDFALSNFAQALGQTADAQALAQRSLGYRKLYDPSTGFLRQHTADGQIPDDGFSPNNFGLSAEYVEADAYQSEFCPQHDIDGLAQLWGGKDKLVAALSQLFDETKQERTADQAQAANPPDGTDPDLLNINLPPTYYFAGNEPDIHYAYLFAEAGRPDLTEEWVPWLRSTFFSAQPDGLPGNDDGGTMSAWYVFSALGLYPVPGSDQYVVGTPMFPRVDIQVSGGVFSVEATGVSDANIYVQSATLNGQPLNSPMIHQADLKSGGSLVLQMGPNPSKWGQGG